MSWAHWGYTPTRAGFFDDPLVLLLVKLADSLSFALDAIQKEERRQKAERALRESEERFRFLVQSVTDYIYTVRVENGRAV